jgi:hypothetical protein
MRLSTLIGDQLSNNNPDIADLSDEYRPTKLVEKYQELYDNQRTNAFEMAEEFFLNETEKTIITALQQILQVFMPTPMLNIHIYVCMVFYHLILLCKLPYYACLIIIFVTLSNN